MTTRITVHADHGWPVLVTAFSRASVGTAETASEAGIVQPGTSQDFHVWDGHDLRVHEIQPGELPANLTPPPDP